jgi:hypothetical protein
MVKRIALIRVTSFLFLAACGAWCQSETSSAALSRRGASNSLDAQRPEIPTGQSLPDAPSVQRAEKSATFVSEARSQATSGAFGITPHAIRKTELGRFIPRIQIPRPQPGFAALHEPFIQKGSNNLFEKYLYPSLLKQSLRYHPSTSSSFMGRATYAASRIIIARDAAGKGRLNTSYFVGILTSAAIHSAYRPYWARSASSTFNNFGSTMGNDAGMNIFHEFEPGIRQMVKGHAPQFVSRIEQRITGNESPRPVVSPLTR